MPSSTSIGTSSATPIPYATDANSNDLNYPTSDATSGNTSNSTTSTSSGTSGTAGNADYDLGNPNDASTRTVAASTPSAVDTTTPAQASLIGSMQNTAQGNVGELSGLNSQIAQVAGSSLANPFQGYNPQQDAQTQLGNLDKQNAAATETARQQLGQTSDSGVLQNNFLQTILSNLSNRATTAATLNKQAADEQQQLLMNALNMGEGATTNISGTNTALMGQLGTAENAAQAASTEQAGETEQTQAEATQAALQSAGFTEEQIQTYTTAQNNMAEAAQQGGIQLALQNNQGAIASALSAQNFGQAMSLQVNQDAFVGTQNANQLALQKYADDLQAHNAEAGTILTAIENGVVSGATGLAELNALATSINSTLPGNQQITFNAPDASTILTAATTQYNQAMSEFALSHTGDTGMTTTDANNNVVLTDAGKLAFANEYNQTQFGENSAVQGFINAGIPNSQIFGTSAVPDATQTGGGFNAQGTIQVGPNSTIPLAQNEKVGLATTFKVDGAPAIPAGQYTAVQNGTGQFLISSDGTTAYPTTVNGIKNNMPFTYNGETYSFNQTTGLFQNSTQTSVT